MIRNGILILLIGVVAMAALWRSNLMSHDPSGMASATPVPEGSARATFGGGCFWCTEAVFQRLKGVQSVVSGYTGGHVKNPTYRQICNGNTGHAEVIQVTFDPKTITYAEVLDVFFKTHDPTTKDRQGNDEGPQYRSAIFHHDDEQKRIATELKQTLNASGEFAGPIVTEIVPLTEFYPAEQYHQNYFNDNRSAGYCRFVIQPKVEKFERQFREKVR